MIPFDALQGFLSFFLLWDINRAKADQWSPLLLVSFFRDLQGGRSEFSDLGQQPELVQKVVLRDTSFDQ
jgi:hypothetical protein